MGTKRRFGKRKVVGLGPRQHLHSIVNAPYAVELHTQTQLRWCRHTHKRVNEKGTVAVRSVVSVPPPSNLWSAEPPWH